MRMRRRAHTDERLLVKNDYFISTNDDEENTVLLAEEKAYLNLKEIFGNDNPIYLEVGCGQGYFACETAKRNPDVNVLALERISSVILSGVERASEEKIDNVRFLRAKAELLPRYLRDGSVKVIFLNFSTPLPKKGYAKQRLTSERFLKIYHSLLTTDGKIHQKTDDEAFFDFSIEQFENCGFKIINLTRNLHANGEVGILTEYERKFVNKSMPIYALTAEKE